MMNITFGMQLWMLGGVVILTALTALYHEPEACVELIKNGYNKIKG